MAERCAAAPLRIEVPALRIPSSSRRTGFSLLEVTISLFVLSITGGALMSSLVSNMMTNRVNRETALAHEAVRHNMERLQAAGFRQVFASFNNDPSDDPGGFGTAPGGAFPVTGLRVQPGDPDGLVGRIVMPAVPGAGTTEELREDFVEPTLGMPRDLDVDGVIDALNHAGDYRILPIRVLVEWRGVSGDRALQVQTLLAEI